MTSSHRAPPDTLSEPLELDPDDWQATEVYFLLTGLVIPRPIAWVSTVSEEGVRNLAPHSYFNAVAHNPPHVMFSSSGVKDTLRNVRATKQFVVNIVDVDLVEKMNFTSTNFPPDEDEFGWAGLDVTPSRRVVPPRVGEAKAHFECELHTIVEAGNGNVVIGRVVHMHVDPSVWKAGRVDPKRLDPVCRLAGAAYATLGEVFKIARPTWDQVEGSTGAEAMPRRR